MVKKLPDKQMRCVNCRERRIFPGLFLFLALLFTLNVTASNYPQVTLDVKSGNLRTVLVQLKDAANVKILFNEDAIRNVKCSSVTLRNAPLDEALDAILKNTGFTYKKVNDVFVINPSQMQQQPASVKISGLVIDPQKTPLIGVSIANIVKKTGAITLTDGRYELDVVEGDKLRFSYIGYKTREIVVTSNMIRTKTLNVTLTEDVLLIEGVAVIGYGTTQKIKDATGSIAHLGIKAIETSPTSSTIQSMLQGRAAGVNVQIQSASPTSPISVIIRGQSSLLGNNQPLWVIDGIPEYNTGLSGTISNVLYSLNLNDVESIDILKDASSTAIYGSRAANGVIVVTTKSGKAGRKPTIEFSTKLGIQKMDFNGYDYFTAKEYIHFTQQAARKEFFAQGSMNYFTRQYLDESSFLALNTSEVDIKKILDHPDAYYGEDNHWLSMSTQNPFQQQYDLSARGGSEVINYVAGLYVKDSEGVVKGSYSRTYGVRLKLNTKINKSLKFWININASTRSTSSKDEMMERLKGCRPDIPKYNPDGTFFNKDPYTENPLNYLENTNKSTGESFAGIAALEYTLIDGLTFSTKGSINYLNGESQKYNRMGSLHATTNSRGWSSNKSDTKIWDNSVMYAKLFNKHDILANITFSMERFQSLSHSMSASGFPDDEVLNSFSNATKYNNMGEGFSENSMLSLIGRFQYKYDNRYLATATFRRDGSSRFGPDNRWGLFPSVGAGWILSNEKLMQHGWIGRNLSHAKIRASYGKAGSQNLGNYQWMSMVSSNVYNEAPGIYPMNIGNMALRWEETLMTDIALELEFWDSRIKSMFGFFKKDARNLIYEQTLPPSTAFSSMTSNIASTVSRGFEFNIDVDILRNDKWWLTFNVNGATNTTKVTKFNNSMTEWKLSNSYTMIEKGGKIGNWYGYKSHKRLLGSGEEAAALKSRDPKTGAIRNYFNTLESEGDIYLVDINGDGIVNMDDQTVLGSSLPKLFGGFGLNLQVGTSLYVGANFSYSLGNKRLWSMAKSSMQTGNYNQSNKIAGMSAVLKDPRNPATFPNATPYDLGYNTTFSDYWLYDASYVRLNSLNIRYRFGEEFFKRAMIQNVELSFQADNLFTITKYPGFDPQGNFSSATQIMATQGVDYSFYPAARTFTLGAKITF